MKKKVVLYGLIILDVSILTFIFMFNSYLENITKLDKKLDTDIIKIKEENKKLENNLNDLKNENTIKVKNLNNMNEYIKSLTEKVKNNES